MVSAALIASLQTSLESYRYCHRWWIACSGGVDSLVLLHATAALVRAAPAQLPSLGVIHINHQLNPHAAQWAQQVQNFCAEQEINCVVKTIEVDCSSGEGIEAAARRARYAAFDEVVGANELLLQAHHCDDQVETFFLRLLRGAGIAGLTAMPTSRRLKHGELLRPLLTVNRADIVEYAQAHDLTWVEDSSNRDTRFDRNFLRQSMLPLLAQRWLGYRDTIMHAIAHFVETDDLLQEYAAADVSSLLLGDGSIDGSALALFSPARQRVVLRQWLQEKSFALPGRAQLDEVLQMIAAADDAEPCVQWVGVEVRRYQAHLYAMQSLPALQANFDMPWLPPQSLHLPAGYGTLLAQPQTGVGLRADRDYRVRNRRGGERCHPLARTHSQTLKKLLQEAEVPPWWRDRVPLIFCGDELAAVGDLWICRGFATAADASGWLPFWRRPGTGFPD